MSVDQANRPPHGLPDLSALSNAFAEFVTTVSWLRDNDLGCPWDLEQDHKSLRRYMVEEAYEAADAMTAGDDRDICDELGDVLLQVVLNAQVAKDRGAFSLVDVIQTINSKMRRRHPHVFADGEAATSEEVRGNWDKIKTVERLGKKAAGGVFAGVEKKHPATSQALAIGKTASKIHFDWDSVEDVMTQVRSEVDELSNELAQKPFNRSEVAHEVGDVYFSLAQLCRHLELDPETVAMDGNRKFLKRFERLESIAASKGVDVRVAERHVLEELWGAAKRAELDQKT